MDLSKTYDAKEHEVAIYRLWEESGYFSPDKLPRSEKQEKKSKDEPFVIAIPPPNVTGSLHMGHALNATIQDILIRRKRMQGYRALWIPGTDHAGIATQNVVEKELKNEGKSRHDLGREKFIERVWEWKEKYGNITLGQLKKLGASCDWSRTRFTMDEGYAKAVDAAFLHYYEKGWIYKGRRVVSWCTRCQTSLSDLELERKEEKSFLWHIRYPLQTRTDANPAQTDANESSQKFAQSSREFAFMVVATTRPETMLGDEAIAVHPEDERYRKLIGKKVVLPLQGREIPIVADAAVDRSFGTGAVKVTPAHDFADFEIAERHDLPLRVVIDTLGRMTKEAGAPYENTKVAEARAKVVDNLRAKGLIEKEEPYVHNLAVCYRCGTTVEPLPLEQWFVKMEGLGHLAADAVRSGKVRFHPERWQKLYFDWLDHIKDWCISRQIWWGHRIPVWYCGGRDRARMPRMGWHADIAPEVPAGKSRTYRLRDHGLAVGDRVIFENTQTRTVFGSATITAIERKAIRVIPLPDAAHSGKYRTTQELIAAFKRLHPEKDITENTEATIYDYTFETASAVRADEGCGQIIASSKRPEACPACGGKNFSQDADVLDTWFSSALWPFAILGWPFDAAQGKPSVKTPAEKSSDLEKFYPTQVLSTDRGIINLWVARMVFSGLEFIGKEPFRDVIIHATVLTKEGKRMSKSKGTGIDPMDLIEKYGADATRFGLIWLALGGQDIKFGEESAIAGKKFLNKIWNAARFVREKTNGKLTKQFPGSTTLPENTELVNAVTALVASVDKKLDTFEFGHALHEIYEFFWHTFCDKHLEWSKGHDDEETKAVLGAALVASVKLLHPFIPFLTEFLWQEFKREGWTEQLMIAEWPKQM